MAMVVLIIIQILESYFSVVYSNTFYIIMQVRVYKTVATLRSRSREEGVNPIILPLKQGLWGAQPPRCYRVFSIKQDQSKIRREKVNWRIINYMK